MASSFSTYFCFQWCLSNLQFLFFSNANFDILMDWAQIILIPIQRFRNISAKTLVVWSNSFEQKYAYILGIIWTEISFLVNTILFVNIRQPHLHHVFVPIEEINKMKCLYRIRHHMRRVGARVTHGANCRILRADFPIFRHFWSDSICTHKPISFLTQSVEFLEGADISTIITESGNTRSQMDW